MTPAKAGPSLESDFFKRSRPDFAGLTAFGFEAKEDGYEYSETILDGQFRAYVYVAATGVVRGRLIDTETDEEYLPIRVRNQMGEFVGEVREAYFELLARIRDACFAPVHFIYDQSNRIESRIALEYGVNAEFPWEKFDGNGIFRSRDNGKWFAALLTVEYGKLAGGEAPDAEQIVEVLNVKADPEQIADLVRRPGLFRAWHMNKKHWISVLLNDTVPDDAVMDLVRESRRLAGETPGKKIKSTGAWMIPSNPAVYDVDEGFRRGGGEIEWHQHNQVKPGDQLYIYCSAPYSAIMYHCEIVAADLPYDGMFKESKGYKKSMRIRLIEKYPQDRYPLAFIKAHGGSVVRSARTMPAQLLQAINK